MVSIDSDTDWDALVEAQNPLIQDDVEPMVLDDDDEDDEAASDGAEERAHNAMATLEAAFPDADPQYLRFSYDEAVERGRYNAVNDVVDALLENPKYPRRLEQGAWAEPKQQAAAAAAAANTAAGSSVNPAVNLLPRQAYWEYHQQCRNKLCQEFSTVPALYIDGVVHRSPNYVDAWTELYRSLFQMPPPYTRIRQARKKHVDITHPDLLIDVAKTAGAKAKIDAERAKEQAEKDQYKRAEENGELIECQCCFSEFLDGQMTQCPDGHLFCLTCARTACENEIGLRRIKMKCLSSEGCTLEFSVAELGRILSTKTLEGYHKLVAQENLRQANLENFYECPFCDWGAIVEDDSIVLFHCENDSCKTVSCLKCKRKSHIPLTCAEHEKEHMLEARHQVEEDMTKAMVRECPKCKKRYLKFDGCNKITCSCGTKMCYVCKQVITGYEHFDDRSRGGAPDKCPLWDKGGGHHHDADVRKAQATAVDQVLQQNKHLEAADAAKVLADLIVPKAPSAAAPTVKLPAYRPPPLPVMPAFAPLQQVQLGNVGASLDQALQRVRQASAVQLARQHALMEELLGLRERQLEQRLAHHALQGPQHAAPPQPPAAKAAYRPPPLQQQPGWPVPPPTVVAPRPPHHAAAKGFVPPPIVPPSVVAWPVAPLPAVSLQGLPQPAIARAQDLPPVPVVTLDAVKKRKRDRQTDDSQRKRIVVDLSDSQDDMPIVLLSQSASSSSSAEARRRAKGKEKHIVVVLD